MQTNFNCKAVEVTEKVRVRQNKNLLAKVKKNRSAIIAAWNCDAAINKKQILKKEEHKNSLKKQRLRAKSEPKCTAGRLPENRRNSFIDRQSKKQQRQTKKLLNS